MKKIIFPACLALLASCLKMEPMAPSLPDTSFDFTVSEGIQFDLSFADAQGGPLAGVPVDIWDAPEEAGGKLWFRGLTGAQGQFDGAAVAPRQT
ncbi:MAG: hypothetical protein AAFQ98_15280, partial [Bacteroidota bacterium]